MNTIRFDPSFTRLGETAVFPYTNATRNNAKIENKNLVSKSAFQIRTESKNTIHYHCSSRRYDSASSIALSFAMIQTLHNQ